MIREELIESVITKMEAEDFDDLFASEQSDYWHYLNSDSFKGMTATENQLSFFINSVIYHAVKETEKEVDDFDIELFQQLEEANWVFREKSKSWVECKDAFFENYKEEDLLAFVEDMLADEDEEISELSKEVVFITAKTYVDYLVMEE